MKIMRNILAALLALTLLCSTAFASSGFNAGLEVDRSEEGKISVTVADSNVLKTEQPTLTIPCDYTYAKVTAPDGSVQYCVIAEGNVFFTVSMGGQYLIEKIDSIPSSGGGTGGSITPPVNYGWDNPFSDVKAGAWYYDSVKTVCQAGLMKGNGDGTTFSPSAKLTRAMMMTILARMDGVDTTGSNPWYKEGMDWAVAEKVSDGTNPTANITREQIAVMLYRFAGEPSVSGDWLKSFPDGDSVSDWAVAGMNWAVARGIIKGVGSKLNPQGDATRAEAAAMMARFLPLK